MKYKSCKYIQTGIAFRHDAVTFCNKLWGIKRYEKFNIPYEEDDFYERFIRLREKTIENCKQGILPHEGCESCPYVEEKEWDYDTRFREIEITHWTHCNCSCCYCSMLPVTKGVMTNKKMNSEEIELYPVIKRMLEEGAIHQTAFFSITGGELTMLKEFPAIMKLLLKQKSIRYGFCLQTNGIKYEPLLAKALNKYKKAQIVVSIDAGSRELFKIMKKQDKYNDVLKNMKHYIKDIKYAKDNVVAKYILVPNVNDTKAEIDKWIADCKKAGIRTLHPSIEFCSQVQKNDCFRDSQAEMYNYLKDKIIENGFNIIQYDFLDNIIDNKTFDITRKQEND